MKKATLKWSLPMAILLLIGCKKEGCMDADSINFDAEAKKENGTCIYEGSNVFWYGEETAEILVGEGVTSVTFYVNEKVVGSAAANVYWGIAPNCGDDASITITESLGSVKTQAFSYRVEDQDDWVLWEGTLNFNANSCISVELN